jgi:hypothetical protein
MNTASNTRLWLTTQVGQAHVATGVPLNLGTNTQPSHPRTQQNTKPRVYRPTPVRLVSTTGPTGLCWWELATSTKWIHTGQAGATHRSDRSEPESPPNHQTGQPTSKLTQTRNNSNTGQQRTHPDVHPSKNPPRVAPVRPVKSTG